MVAAPSGDLVIANENPKTSSDIIPEEDLEASFSRTGRAMEGTMHLLLAQRLLVASA